MLLEKGEVKSNLTEEGTYNKTIAQSQWFSQKDLNLTVI